MQSGAFSIDEQTDEVFLIYWVIEQNIELHNIGLYNSIMSDLHL